MRARRSRGWLRQELFGPDLGTPELQARRLALVGGADSGVDPALSELPLGRLLALGLITREEIRGASVYAWLYRRATGWYPPGAARIYDGITVARIRSIALGPQDDGPDSGTRDGAATLPRRQEPPAVGGTRRLRCDREYRRVRDDADIPCDATRPRRGTVAGAALRAVSRDPCRSRDPVGLFRCRRSAGRRHGDGSLCQPHGRSAPVAAIVAELDFPSIKTPEKTKMIVKSSRTKRKTSIARSYERKGGKGKNGAPAVDAPVIAEPGPAGRPTSLDITRRARRHTNAALEAFVAVMQDESAPAAARVAAATQILNWGHGKAASGESENAPRTVKLAWEA